MSGGHFDYNQYRISEIKDQIDAILEANLEEKPWYDYKAETKEAFKKASFLLELAAIYVHRIDWLVSGDDTEENFHARLKEDLQAFSASSAATAI